MKILYAIQATGNGHLSRAKEIIPHLLAHGETDLFVSGTNSDIALPYFIKYKKHGLSFQYSKNGGIDYIGSVKKLKPIQLLKDIQTFPVNQYDVIINDFEPVTAWACKLKRKNCIALSHQSAFLSANTPVPEESDKISSYILRNYAPTTDAIGLHFMEYDTFIRKPIIRSEVRQLNITNKNHITVYLPAFHDQLLIQKLVRIKDIEWHIFSKYCKYPYTFKHIHVQPIENSSFLQSLASSSGVITGGGFEGPAEALFLKKKIMSIPIQGQFEQQSNAYALSKMGITILHQLTNNFIYHIENWINDETKIEVDYPDMTAQITNEVVFKALQKKIQSAEISDNHTTPLQYI